MTIKTTDDLIKHLKDNGIEMNDGTDRQQLKILGYGHLYKGYRFYRKSGNRLPFKRFEQIRRTYRYDMDLKNLFYRWTSLLETAFKNVILQKTIEFIQSDSISDFYNLALESGTSLPERAKAADRSKATSNKLQEIKFLQSKVYESYCHGNPIIRHHYDRDDSVPLWGLFEILMFGEVGNLVRCLKLPLRQAISREIGLNLKNDPGARMLEHYIFLVKDLRNGIAHDNVIYDGRFIKNLKGSGIRKICMTALESETGIANINFINIEDFLILICYLLKLFGVDKQEIHSLINEYISLTSRFMADIDDPDVIKHQIRYDTIPKAQKLLRYLK